MVKTMLKRKDKDKEFRLSRHTMTVIDDFLMRGKLFSRPF